jgi:nucleoside-diphosphate-sugar epimerase
MKTNALIGHTGFIGSNLKQEKKFNFKKFYNSKNIDKIINKDFNLVLCAGTYSKIWIANKKPKNDLKSIKRLIKNLEQINCRIFILISTIEVYGKKSRKNEKSKIFLSKKKSPYINNRIYLENFIKKKFSNYLIIRLPIIYGKNFKKNCIYDLLNKNQINELNGSDLIQILNVNQLPGFIFFALKKKINEVNISPEPIRLSHIAKKLFGKNLKKKLDPRTMSMKTIYKYFNITKEETIKHLRKFCEKY